MKLSKLLIASLMATTLSAPALAQGGVSVGQLTCDVAGGTGFIFGSSKNLTCAFTPANSDQPRETYTGSIEKFGIDIGFTGKTVILWSVVTAEAEKYAPGSLAGTYSGATAEAAFAAGLGANVLVGGSNKGFALQPVSVSASSGVNVAAGFARVRLRK
ncbi:MAG: DUF992 domain-containing protein [Pseudomonadota bacterium]